MTFVTTYHTVKGIHKTVNQDGLMIKTAKTVGGEVGFFVVCDGMGGLEAGELASSMVIEGLSDWFHQQLPELLQSEEFEEHVCLHMENKIKHLNEELLQYGEKHQIQAGTTVTAVLLLNQKYYAFQVGDSRAYVVNHSLRQITTDQTLVARELARGVISKEEAITHPKRHVLLQCIGVQPIIDVDVSQGELTEDDFLLLCTDGFYHKLSDQEIIQALGNGERVAKQTLDEKVFLWCEQIRERQETDDISVVLVKPM